MKKKIVALALVLLLGTGNILTGCGNAQEGDGTMSADESTQTKPLEDESEMQEVTALELMKAFNNRKLNIIEDQYRNYYEIFVYSFYDSDGDGIGDLQGVISQLDYINDGSDMNDTDLGMNGIWLMPIMPSTTYHKYDVTDYCAIDEEYGTLEDFEELVKESHERGIAVTIDFVMNHTSSQHPWFQEAVSYLKGLSEGEEPDEKECPYVGYYNFSKEKQSGYSQLDGTDWYYEAQFWSEMPDLNLGNEAVREEFEKIVDFWLALGVDGFRMDAAKEYYTGNDEKNVEVLTWFHDMVTEKKEDAYIVAEVWNDKAIYAKYYASGIDSCFNFDFAGSDGIIANTLKMSKTEGAGLYGKAVAGLDTLFSQYSDSYVDAPFYTNHDMARSAGYYAGEYSENQTKMAQAMNLFMTGNAFLYYGEELGMKGAGKDENKRAAMYWSADANAKGMCKGPMDMDKVTMKYGSLEEQKKDENSIYYFVKEAIRLRNCYPEIARGDVEFLEEVSNESVCVLRKTYQEQEILLVFNLSNETQTVDLSAVELSQKSGADLEIGGLLLTEAQQVTIESGKVEMPLYSVLLLK